MAAPVKSSPRDAQVMAAILKDMGVTDHEPRLINQMLEFTYRYVTDVLEDAKVYSSHANKKSLDTEDVQLAVQCRMDHSFTTPPPRDLLLEIARHKNNQSLPLIKPYSGPRLPPDRYCLSAPNYRLINNRKKQMHRIQIGLPVNQFGGGHRISLTPVHKQQPKIQIGTPSQHPLTVINRPSQVKPIQNVVRVQQQGSTLLQGSVPGTVSMPGGLTQIQGSVPGTVSMPGGLTQIQGSVPGTVSMPSGLTQIQGNVPGTVSMPGGLTQIQGNVPGSVPMPGGLTQIQGSVPGTVSMPGGLTQIMPAAMTTSIPAAQTIIPHINPLKRKLDDDDYDQT